jgi:hypothetical protein
MVGITGSFFLLFHGMSGAFPIQVESVVLGAFAKLREATISFVMSVRMEQLGSDWTDFHENCSNFGKNCRENSSFINIFSVAPCIVNFINFINIFQY